MQPAAGWFGTKSFSSEAGRLAESGDTMTPVKPNFLVLTKEQRAAGWRGRGRHREVVHQHGGGRVPRCMHLRRGCLPRGGALERSEQPAGCGDRAACNCLHRPASLTDINCRMMVYTMRVMETAPARLPESVYENCT